MKETGAGRGVQTHADQEQVERLITVARDICEMTSLPGWRILFGNLQKTAVDAALELTTAEDPVVFFRCQGTLACARSIVADLRQPFQDLKRMDPNHPLAGHELPCAVAFDEALANTFRMAIKPEGHEVQPHPAETTRQPWTDEDALHVPGLGGHWDWFEDPDEEESRPTVEPDVTLQGSSVMGGGDPPAAPAAPAPKPGSRKFKHPWRVRFVDRK